MAANIVAETTWPVRYIYSFFILKVSYFSIFRDKKRTKLKELSQKAYQTYKERSEQLPGHRNRLLNFLLFSFHDLLPKKQSNFLATVLQS